MANALDEALRIVREGAKLDTAPSMKALAAEIERLYAIEEVVLAVPALVAEVERLRAIETATRAAYSAEKAWREGGGMNAELAGTMCDARHRLRELLEKGGAK